MVGILKKIYNILCDIDIVDENQYNKLISIYGKKMVDSVIDNILITEDDENNLVKFDFYLSTMFDESSSFDLNSYEMYLGDINQFMVFDSSSNEEYIKKTCEIIEELNCLCDEVGCDDSILHGKCVPWISEKFNYCLEHSSDKEFLKRLSETYKQYCYYRDALVQGNLRLVISIAAQYNGNTANIPFEDIIQWGNIGLMQAVEKFRPETGAMFSTCAGYWIKQNIIRNIRYNSFPLRLPLNMIYDNYNRLNVRDKLSAEFGREATERDVFKYRVEGYSFEEIANILNRDIKSIYNTFHRLKGKIKKIIEDDDCL